jgi:hypothetical protein
MARGPGAGHDAGMSIDVSLHEAAALLRDPAPVAPWNGRGHRDAMPPPVDLEELGVVLRLAADVLDRAAEQLVPNVGSTHRVCDRYRAAVASWPTTPAPSYERLAGLLATLHDAGAAVRRAATKCDGADTAVRAALGLSSPRVEARGAAAP